MPELDIGPSESAGPGGIPTKWLLIGGGGVILAFVFLMNKGGSSSSTPDATAGGAQLGPNAALALGSLQSDFRRQLGDFEQQMSTADAALGDKIGAQGADIQGQFGNVNLAQNQIWNQMLAYYNTLAQGQNQIWNKLGNPAWMPGGADDPWQPHSDESQPTTTLPVAS